MRKPDDRDGKLDPNVHFLGEQSQARPGNSAGLELGLYRLVRWLMPRGRSSR